MSFHKVVKYATRSQPEKNEWWLALELEDGSKTDRLRATSASDLDALCHVLRHSEEVNFERETGTLETSFVSPGQKK
jgi:hypothetical protein